MLSARVVEACRRVASVVSLYDPRVDADTVRRRLGYSVSYYQVFLSRLRRRYRGRSLHLRSLGALGLRVVAASAPTSLRPRGVLGGLVYMCGRGVRRGFYLFYAPRGLESRVAGEAEGQGFSVHGVYSVVPRYRVQGLPGSVGGLDGGVLDDLSLLDVVIAWLLDSNPLASLRELARLPGGGRLRWRRVVERYRLLSSRGVLGRVLPVCWEPPEAYTALVVRDTSCLDSVLPGLADVLVEAYVSRDNAVLLLEASPRVTGRIAGIGADGCVEAYATGMAERRPVPLRHYLDGRGWSLEAYPEDMFLANLTRYLEA